MNPAVGLEGPGAKPDSRSALALGYAVVTTDGGHQAQGFALGDGSFGADPGAREDYNSLSTRRVMEVARQLVKARYGSGVRHAYFTGCSNGGREGLMTAERFPEEFDGVVAGAPAFNLTHAAIAEAWNTVSGVCCPERWTGDGGWVLPGAGLGLGCTLGGRGFAALGAWGSGL